MQQTPVSDEPSRDRVQLQPAWAAFIKYCERMGHGEIEKLKIQDGLPVLAEVTTQKVKFG
jgi:hypothetical protein